MFAYSMKMNKRAYLSCGMANQYSGRIRIFCEMVKLGFGAVGEAAGLKAATKVIIRK